MMAAEPPPLPQWYGSTPPTPPPLPPMAVGALPYHRLAVNHDVRWVTVALLSTAQWHAACRLLSDQRIISRIDADTSESNESGLQVLSTEAEWAREILSKGIPGIVGLARPPGGFPVSAIAPPSGAAMYPATVPVAAMPVAALAPALSQGAPSHSGLYYPILFILWIALILIVLFMILVIVAQP